MKLKPPPIAPALMSQLSAPAHGMTERWYLDNAPKLVPTFRKGKLLLSRVSDWEALFTSGSVTNDLETEAEPPVKSVDAMLAGMGLRRVG